MEIFLSFEKDRTFLEDTFQKQIQTLTEKGLQTEMETRTTKCGFRVHFYLKDINDHWFLLPLNIAKTLSVYTTECREQGFLEEILQKYYFFLDNDIKKDTRRLLTAECKNKETTAQRQMLLFFPIINYFSQHLPMIEWNYEGFLLFRAKGYWASLDQMIAVCAEEAFLAEERKYQKILYPDFHKEEDKEKKNSTSKKQKR